jgi:hypothetical protein
MFLKNRFGNGYILNIDQKKLSNTSTTINSNSSKDFYNNNKKKIL